MSIPLSPRLQAVAQWVPRDCRFADIGTDHAYLPAWLLRQGVISRAIAGDLRLDPIARARATAARYGLADKIDLRHSNGLQALAPHEVDCIAIAGMGGENIRSILADAPWTLEQTRLILQPQTNLPQLRQWLTEAGYRIQADCCVREENRWYTILLTTGGQDTTVWTPGSLMAGDPARWSETRECRRDYLRFLLRRTRQQLNGISQAESPNKSKLTQLRQAETELTQWLTQLTQEETI